MTELAAALGFTKKKDVAFVVKSVMEVCAGVRVCVDFLQIVTMGLKCVLK